MGARSTSPSSSRLSLVIVIIASAALGFLGVLYILASAYAPVRLLVGVTLIGLALFLLIFASRKLVKPPPIVVYWAPSGPLKPEELKCPNCGAPLKIAGPKAIRIVCEYCGRVMEIVEEPKW
ncbi:MAG: hypothetical protein AOA65_0277 [Candidatus Bathyarchaeota archaeon BA1]|nr:MAG: hypothetical protein AOA65_0277 [Candidatus Bathyarchaeota archaeon BA1]